MANIDHSLLVYGIAAAKAKEIEEARRYFELFLMREPPLEEKIEAWFWMSEISSDPSEQWSYIENILANEPGDPRARRKAAILKGDIKPDEIVNPDRLSPTDSIQPQDIIAQRFTCPQCGGRLVFAPDGQSLTCEYCDSKRLLAKDENSADLVTEDDFFAALATAKGHRNPVRMQIFSCTGCGTSFIRPPEQLTATCPYCDSNYVVNQNDAKDIIEPAAIIPFQITEKMAKDSLRAWLHEIELPFLPKFAMGNGLYIPVWSFDISGEISWRYMEVSNKKKVERKDVRQIIYNDILILATHHIPKKFSEIIHQFELNQLVPYQPDFLVNWLAETYQIDLGNASLVARQIAVDKEKEKLQQIGFPRNSALNTSKIYIDVFKLLLFPVWLTHYTHQDKRYAVIINGQSGNVMADSPESGISQWISRLISP